MLCYVLRSRIKRSFSDGNIVCPSNLPVEDSRNEQREDYEPPLPEKEQVDNNGMSEFTPDVSTCESEMSYSRSLY